MFNFDSALLLLSVVVHLFWKIEKLGEATEFFFSLAIEAIVLFLLEFYFNEMIAMAVE